MQFYRQLVNNFQIAIIFSTTEALYVLFKTLLDMKRKGDNKLNYR